MNQTNVRKLKEVEDLAALPRAERIAALRARMTALAAPEETNVQHLNKQVEADCVPVPRALGELLDGGGLARGCAYQFSFCPQLIAQVIAHTSAQGGSVGVVGWPEFGFAAVHDAGGDLTNIIAVPDPGPEPLNTAAVLTEGLDVVLYKGADVALSPVKARPLLAKLRVGRASLIAVGTRVPSAQATITGTIQAYHGIGAGTGRIRGIDIALTVEGRGGVRRGAMNVGSGVRHAQPTLRVV